MISVSELVLMFNRYANERGFGPRIAYLEGSGFATYHLNGEECYIEDIFVVPEKRKHGIAAEIANSITGIAKANGCKYLSGSVSTQSKTKNESMKVLLAYGMSLCGTNGDMIYLKKEI